MKSSLVTNLADVLYCMDPKENNCEECVYGHNMYRHITEKSLETKLLMEYEQKNEQMKSSVIPNLADFFYGGTLNKITVKYVCTTTTCTVISWKRVWKVSLKRSMKNRMNQ